MKILFGGDYIPGSNVLANGCFEERQFDDFKSVAEGNDFTVLNLETVINADSAKTDKTGVSFNSDVETLTLFDLVKNPVVCLANNHINDYGKSGIKSTIEALKNKAIKHTGAGIDEKSARNILYLEGDKKVAVLNYCEHEFSTSDIYSHGANGYTPEKVFYDIREAGDKADFIIVVYHGNLEYFSYPSPGMQERLRFIADLGADVVISHHSHYYSGYEIYNDTPIFYGLGNFYSKSAGKRSKEFHTGIFVELLLNDNADFNLIPYYQNSDKPGIQILNESDKNLFFDNLKKINDIITDKSKLNQKWQDFVESKKSKYFYILKQQNKFLYQLVKKGLLDNSKISGDKLPFLLNIIRNESHREAVITLLENRMNKLS